MKKVQGYTSLQGFFHLVPDGRSIEMQNLETFLGLGCSYKYVKVSLGYRTGLIEFIHMNRDKFND